MKEIIVSLSRKAITGLQQQILGFFTGIHFRVRNVTGYAASVRAITTTGIEGEHYNKQSRILPCSLQGGGGGGVVVLPIK